MLRCHRHDRPTDQLFRLPSTVTATFFSAGLVALILPWGFILTWIGRVVVWGFLGPHMKLVDLFLRANEKKDGGFNDLMKNFDIQSNSARLNREQALKVKDVKEVAFGKYSVQVPSFNVCKFTLHDQISAGYVSLSLILILWSFFQFLRFSTSFRSTSASVIFENIPQKSTPP